MESFGAFSFGITDLDLLFLSQKLWSLLNFFLKSPDVSLPYERNAELL
jgi:hypothetical protein